MPYKLELNITDEQYILGHVGILVVEHIYKAKSCK